MPAADGGPTEKEWQRTVVELLDAMQWANTHTYPLRTEHGWRTGTTAKGWPDLVAIRGAFVVGIECKTDRGRADPEQLVWLSRFSYLAGGRAWLLRPRDDLSLVASWLRTPADAPRVYGFERP